MKSGIYHHHPFPVPRNVEPGKAAIAHGVIGPNRSDIRVGTGRWIAVDRQSEAKATPPEVDSERLALVLRDTYAKPGTSTWRGNGKASAALAHELGTGERTGNDRFHAVDVADLLGRYHKLLRHDRTLTERDHLVAVTESTELWSALQAPDEAGAITRWLLGNPARVRTVLDVADRVRRDPDLAPATGSRFEASPYGRRTLIAAAPLRGLLRDLGAARRGRGAAPPATAGLDPTRIAAAGRPTSSRSPIEPGDGRPGPAAAPAQPHRRRERPGPEPGS